MSVNLGSAYGTIEIDTSKMEANLKGAEKATSDFERKLASMSAGAAEATMVFGGLAAAGTGLIAKMTMTAARTEELGVVVANMGRVHGKAQTELDAYEESLVKLGITRQAARDMMIRLMGSELDLADATKIARGAQDLAVIGMEDSSAAAQNLTYAIQSMQPRLLRKYGIYLNLNEVYEKAAEAQGVEAEQLSESAKRLAWKNAVLEKTTAYMGTYEAAMTSAGKQLRSLPRYIQEASNELGQYFVPMLGDAVGVLTGFLKGIIALPAPIKEGATALLGMGTAFAATVSGVGGVILLLPKLSAALTFLMANPLVLAAAGIAALVAGLYALSKHLEKVEQAHVEQAREILKATGTYTSYVSRLEDAGAGNKALSQEIWEVVRAKLADADATEAEKEAALVLGEKQQKLLNDYERITTTLERLTGKRKEQAEAYREEIKWAMLADPALRDIAEARGILTEAQVEAVAASERMNEIEQAGWRKLEAQQRQAIDIQELLTEEVKENVQERVEAAVEEADGIEKVQEQMAEQQEDFNLSRARSVEDYEDKRAETIRDYQLQNEEALADHQRSLEEMEADFLNREGEREAEYQQARVEKQAQAQEVLAALAISYHKSVEDATEDYHKTLLELEAAYQKDRQAAIAEYEDVLLELEATYQAKRAEKITEYQGNIAELEADYQEASARDQQDFQNRMAALSDDYVLDRERDYQDHLSKMAQMEASYADKVRDERADLASDLKRIESDYQDWLADSEQDYADSRADREQDYRDKMADGQQGYQDDATDLAARYQGDITKAQADGDEERAAELQAAFDEQLALLDRDHQQWLERTERDYEQRAAIEERERQQALERAQREQQQKVELRQQQHQEDMAQLQAEYAEKTQLAEAEHARDTERQAQDFREKLTQQVLAFVLSMARDKADYDAKVAEETAQHGQDLERLDQEHGEKLAKEQEQHQEDLGRMDIAYQEKVAKEDEQHQEKLADLDEKYQEKVAKEQAQHQEAMARLDTEHQERVQKEAEQYKERLEEAKEQYQLARDKAQEAHELRLADETEANAKSMRRADEDHKRRMDELDEDLAEERQAFADHIEALKTATVTGFTAVGEGAGAGLADGLGNSQEEVEQAVSDLIDGMVLKAVEELEMGSPAQRFVPHGVAISEALGVGMLEGAEGLGDIISSILDGLESGAMDQVNDIVDAIISAMGDIPVPDIPGGGGGGGGGTEPGPGPAPGPKPQYPAAEVRQAKIRAAELERANASEIAKLAKLKQHPSWATIYRNEVKALEANIRRRSKDIADLKAKYSFARGGIVPGRMGQPQNIIAHGGEIVAPAKGFIAPMIEAIERPMRQLADMVRPNMGPGGIPPWAYSKGFTPPAPTTIDRGGGGRTVIEVPVYLDGREIARVTSPYFADELQRRGIRALG